MLGSLVNLKMTPGRDASTPCMRRGVTQAIWQVQVADSTSLSAAQAGRGCPELLQANLHVMSVWEVSFLLPQLHASAQAQTWRAEQLLRCLS